jgi:hypothetical protein
MTKKHFEAAAAYMRRLRANAHYDAHADGDAVASIEQAFVDVFRQFNPRFDVDRFRAACREGN